MGMTGRLYGVTSRLYGTSSRLYGVYSNYLLKRFKKSFIHFYSHGKWNGLSF